LRFCLGCIVPAFGRGQLNPQQVALRTQTLDILLKLNDFPLQLLDFSTLHASVLDHLFSI